MTSAFKYHVYHPPKRGISAAWQALTSYFASIDIEPAKHDSAKAVTFMLCATLCGGRFAPVLQHS